MSPFQPFRDVCPSVCHIRFPAKNSACNRISNIEFWLSRKCGRCSRQISHIQRGPQVTDFLIPIVLSEASQTWLVQSNPHVRPPLVSDHRSKTSNYHSKPYS